MDTKEGSFSNNLGENGEAKVNTKIAKLNIPKALLTLLREEDKSGFI